MDTRTTIPVALGIAPEEITQVTSSRGGRVYEVLAVNPSYGFTAHTVPSVTSVVDSTVRNFGLEIWKDQHIQRGLLAAQNKLLTPELIASIRDSANEESSRSADVGSELHNIIDLLLRGEEAVVSPQLEPAVRVFNRWMNSHNWEYVGSEVAVYQIHSGGALGYAGTIDALFKDSWGDYIVCDWKTNKNPKSGSGIYMSNMIQAGAYVGALQEMLNSSVNSGNTNGTHFIADDDRTVPALARGMVVRFCNYYPLGDDGKEDRSQRKIFEDKLECAEVDSELWSKAFVITYALYLTQESYKKQGAGSEWSGKG